MFDVGRNKEAMRFSGAKRAQHYNDLIPLHLAFSLFCTTVIFLRKFITHANLSVILTISAISPHMDLSFVWSHINKASESPLKALVPYAANVYFCVSLPLSIV